MKSLILAIVMSLTFPFGYISFGSILNVQDDDDKPRKVRKYDDLAEKDEFHQTYKLQSNARVEISDISGILEIETTSGDTAEVHIVRSARERKDLEFRKIKVESTGSLLRIYTESNSGFSFRENHRETRQRFLIKLPKQVDLSLNDISGYAEVGDIQGALAVNDISGSISIGQATNFKSINDISGNVRVKSVVNCEQINDISGHVEIGIERISSGLKIHDISGSVNLKFADDVNADLTVRDVSGNVSFSSLSLTITKKYDRNNFEGRIGAGGTSVNISDISGSVKLGKKSLY